MVPALSESTVFEVPRGRISVIFGFIFRCYLWTQFGSDFLSIFKHPGVYVEVSGGAFWGLDRCWELFGISIDFGTSPGDPQILSRAGLGADQSGLLGPEPPIPDG